MIQFEADPGRNLIMLSYSKRVEVGQVKDCREKIQGLLTKAPPGFRLLSDLSGLESMDVACAPHVERLMDLFNKSGVAKVVRIIPDPKKDIGFNIMSLFHYRRRIPIVTVRTKADALKELAG